MVLQKEIYHALESIVGPENISDDPANCQAYSRGGYGAFIYDKNSIPPACVVLPQTTKEVQQIVKVANRYKIPYIPVSTFFLGFSAPVRPNAIMMDLKRMRQ